MAVFNVLGYALLWNHQRPRSTLVALFVIFSILIAVGYVVIWFFWRGANWARILVLITSFLALWNLRGVLSAILIFKAIIVGEAALAVFLIVWLNTSAAKIYFKPDSNRT
jgi:hypothetical protein